MALLLKLKQRAQRLSGRSRAVGMFFATSLAARGVGIGCQLLQVPIAVHALGAEAFGLWMTLTSVGAMLLFADFGMGQGAQNKMAEAFACGQVNEARVWWEAALVFLGGASLLLAGIALLVARAIDPTALFNLVDPNVQAEARGAVAVTLFIFCLNIPLGLAQRLAYSRQRGWMHNLWQAGGSVAALGGTLLGVYLRWPLAGIVAAAQLPLALANAGLLAVQLRQLGWADLRRVRCGWTTMRELWRLGAHFGVQQVQLTLYVSVPQVIISTTLGAAAVTPYNLAQRLFSLFTIIQNAFMLPLWPAYSEAKARGEFDWIRRTLARSLGATLIFTLVPMAVGAWLAQPLIAAWVGGFSAGSATARVELPSTALVWLMFGWNALVFIGQPFGYMLAGVSEVKRLTQTSVVSSLVSLLLMTAWVEGYRQEGVVAGMVVGILPFFLWGNIIEARRVLRRFPERPAADSALIHAPVAAQGGP